MNLNNNSKAYLDNELTAEEKQQFETELANNQALRQEVQDLEQISSSIRAAAKSHSVNGYEATRERLTARNSQPFWAKILAPVALLAILSAFLFPVFAQSKLADSSAAPASMAGAAAETESMPSESLKESPSSAVPSRDRNSALSDDFMESDPKSKSSAQLDSSSSGADLPLPPTSFESNRQVIKNGNLSIIVPSLNAADQAVKAIAQRYQGFVESSSNYAPSSPNAQRNSSYTLRVRASNFDQAMNDISALGDVESSSTSGIDVTTQVVDLEARLRTMRIEEAQYMEVLKSTKRIGDILDVKERIYNVRAEIESIEAQRKELKNLAQLSTIIVNITEEAKIKSAVPGDWFGETFTNASNAFGVVGRYLVKVLVYIAVFSPLWLPFVILWFYKRKKA